MHPLLVMIIPIVTEDPVTAGDRLRVSTCIGLALLLLELASSVLFVGFLTSSGLTAPFLRRGGEGAWRKSACLGIEIDGIFW